MALRLLLAVAVIVAIPAVLRPLATEDKAAALGIAPSTESATATVAVTTVPPAPSTLPPTTAPPNTVPLSTAPLSAIQPPTTQPPTTQPPTGSSASAPSTTLDTSPEARGARVLTAITYPWQSRLAGWEIVFEPGRPGAYGYTYTDQKRIEILVRDDQSDALLAHVIAHEIGHAVDVTLNSTDDRERWQDARGIESSPWWPGSGATDFSTGAGDFAESFAAWQVGSSSFRSNLAGPPSADQLALMAELAG